MSACHAVVMVMSHSKYDVLKTYFTQHGLNCDAETILFSMIISCWTRKPCVGKVHLEIR